MFTAYTTTKGQETMEKLWAFHTKNFSVHWAIEPDYDADLSFDETGETQAKVASGEWVAFISKVWVEFRTCEIGCDYIGGSIYADPREFRDHFGSNRTGYGSYFSDMVRNAISDARKQMKDVPQLRK